MNCDPAALAKSARCLSFNARQARQIWIYLLCQKVNGGSTSVVPSTVILPDGTGGFWALVTDSVGDLGAVANSGPATPDVVLSDGSGGFWKLVVNASGSRGSQSDPGPATVPPVISDGFGGNWQLVVDNAGNLGATSV